MAQAEHRLVHPVVEARASAPTGKGVRVFLRRVSPRGAMVQGGDLPESLPGGVMLLAAPGARRLALPRWRFAPPD